MRKVRSPLIALMLICLTLLSACYHRPEGNRPIPLSFTPFTILVNGPVAIVVQKSKSTITIFSPRDPEGLHELYVNNLEHSQDSSRDYHFTLEQEGLKPSADVNIDHYLSDFVVHTEDWKREKNFFSIEVPMPEKITFAPPLQPITFENGATGYMATNFVFKYTATDYEKIKAVSHELGTLKPLTNAELQTQYARLCSKAAGDRRYHDSCIGVRNLLEQFVDEQGRVLFFGIGRPLLKQNLLSEREASDHAIHFFNDVLLRAFPHLQRLRLASKPNGMEISETNPLLIQASFSAPTSHMEALPVSAVIDCKAGGFIAITTQ
jgi:hypothetical protein